MVYPSLLNVSLMSLGIYTQESWLDTGVTNHFRRGQHLITRVSTDFQPLPYFNVIDIVMQISHSAFCPSIPCFGNSIYKKDTQSPCPASPH